MPTSRSRRHGLRLGAGLLATGCAVSGGLAYATALTPHITDTSSLDDHGGARRLDGDQTRDVRLQVKGGRAKNVILLIGDGMGDSEITIARNYAYGAHGQLPGIDSLPLTGEYTTYSLDQDTGLPDYVTDSAASGTTWSTGTKSYNGAISVDRRGVPQPTILELAKKRGLKTGDVTTSEIQDATPAVLVSHVTERSCYGPAATSVICPTNALENGGAGSITEQLLATRPDVTLGGGATTFAETAKAGPYVGQTLRQQAVRRGYRLVDDNASLSAVKSADQAKPLLGLFGAGNLPVRYVGPAATHGGAALPAATCTANPDRPVSQPSLSQMTSKAISLLNGDKGFFLQVEGASIDKQDHASNACGQIGETVDFDEAVQAAMDFARADGNTSVFVTADHGHTSQIIEVGSSSPGTSVTLQTADGAPMAINYGTSTTSSQQHTGTEVRLAGYGPQAANVSGVTDDTDLFFTMTRALGLKDPSPQAAPAATRSTPFGTP